MNFEPQKFFIGLIDFFSIFLPGAALAYVIKDKAACETFLTHCPSLKETEGVLLFLFGSYLLGHFLFLIGSFLDDLVYDPLRSLTDGGQITKKLIKGERLSPLWLRKIATSHWLFGGGADNALIQAVRIKARALQALEGKNAINAFQWCKARLTKDATALSAIQRFDADSKFFRSFVVVLVVLFFVYAHEPHWTAAGICLLGVVPAFLRYLDQRFKATQQAYWFILAQPENAAAPTPVPRPDGLSHAGGVVFKYEKSTPKFMLVEASKNRDERVLPKGHIEPGEDPRVTAVREIKEETGHWARVECWLGDLPLNEAPDGAPVRWFLLECQEEPRNWRREDRQYYWLTFDEALKATTFEQVRTLLKRADSELKKMLKHRT